MQLKDLRGLEFPERINIGKLKKYMVNNQIQGVLEPDKDKLEETVRLNSDEEPVEVPEIGGQRREEEREEVEKVTKRVTRQQTRLNIARLRWQSLTRRIMMEKRGVQRWRGIMIRAIS